MVLHIYSISVAHSYPILGMNSLALNFYEVRFVNRVLLFLKEITARPV